MVHEELLWLARVAQLVRVPVAGTLGNLWLRDLRIRATSPTAAVLQVPTELTAVDAGWCLPSLDDALAGHQP